MRILQVIAGLHRIGGTTTFAGELSNALAAQGEDVTLAMFRKWGEDDFTLDVRVKGLPIAEVRNRPRDFDVVHVHGLWDREVFWASGWALQSGIPIVWSPHGMLAPWALRNRWWKKFVPWHLYVRRRLARAAAIHVTAKQESEWVRGLGFANSTPVIPLGTDVVNVKVRPPRQTESNLHTLLFVGRLHPVKGLENLLTAWKNSSAKAQGWRLRLVGCGTADYEKRLKQIIWNNQIDSVELVGAKYGSELEQEYVAADSLILPSFTENFGGVVIDALAHGVPVITSKFTPWQEVDGLCGWWCGNTAEELAATLEGMMKLPDVARREMGLKGRSLVEQKYTWTAVAEQMREVYRKVSEEKRT